MHVGSMFSNPYYTCPECEGVLCLSNSKIIKKENNYIVMCPKCKKEFNIYIEVG